MKNSISRSSPHLNSLEIMGSFSIRIGHDLANHVTILSSLASILSESDSGIKESLTNAVSSIQSICVELRTMIDTINVTRTHIPLEIDGTYLDVLLKDLNTNLTSYRWSIVTGESSAIKLLCNSTFLTPTLSELAILSGDNGTISAEFLRSRSAITSLELPMHLGRNFYLHLTYTPNKQMSTIQESDHDYYVARYSSILEIFKLLGCHSSGVHINSQQMTVLIPAEESKS